MTTATPTKHIMIIGAGLCGCLLAHLLARSGGGVGGGGVGRYRISLYERRSDPRAAGWAGGRSINLALSARGIAALATAGLAEQVLTHDAIAMRGRIMHAAQPGAPLVYQPYSSNPQDAINSVSRGGLNLTLLRAASAHPNVELHFDHFCTDVDIDSPRPAAVFTVPGGGTRRVEADLILGGDGAFSAGRLRLQKTDRFQYSQSYLDSGYKELTIPAVPASQALWRREVRTPDRGPVLFPAPASPTEPDFALDPHALHIWPRGGAMMIALPNRDRTFTCTLFWPFQGEHGLHTLQTPEQISAFFSKHYPDAVPLMPTLVQDYLRNPSSSLVTVRCSPWNHQHKLCLLGDAAHAIVPFYGQGMNASFEDAVALADALIRSDDSPAGVADALAAFAADRKPNADAIADMALDNFIEMRDKVGRPAFLHRKRIEQTLHKLFPDRCQPQYNLVSFSTVPYAVAQQRGRELDAVVDRIVTRLPLESATHLDAAAFESAVRHLAADALSPAAPDAPSPAVLDLSPPISEHLAVFPGDTPFRREVLMDIAAGKHITLSTLHTTCHLGSHVDGPNHYGANQVGVGDLPLDLFLGPAHVVQVNLPADAPPGFKFTQAHLGTPLAALRHPRVLLRTGSYPDPNRWTDHFASPHPDLVRDLAQRGVRLLGVDTPSVDAATAKDLVTHAACLAGGVTILEGLVLSAVQPGEYELIALPLRLPGVDGSPVRAVLRPLNVR